MRLIDAINHLKEMLATWTECSECKREHEELLEFLLELQERRAEPVRHGECYPDYVEKCDIDNAPTVDAVEVTRCGDCKYLLKDNSGRNAHLCMRAYFHIPTTIDGFCNHGTKGR